MPQTPDTQLLPTYCAGRDVPCPRCAFNLRDLQTATCPECGHELKLIVAPLGAPSYTPFILTLFAMTMCAGAGLSAWIYPTRLSGKLPNSLHNAFHDLTWPCLLIALALLAFQRLFRALPPLLQWLCAIAALAYMLTIVSIQWWEGLLTLTRAVLRLF